MSIVNLAFLNNITHLGDIEKSTLQKNFFCYYIHVEIILGSSMAEQSAVNR